MDEVKAPVTKLFRDEDVKPRHIVEAVERIREGLDIRMSVENENVMKNILSMSLAFTPFSAFPTAYKLLCNLYGVKLSNIPRIPPWKSPVRYPEEYTYAEPEELTSFFTVGLVKRRFRDGFEGIIKGDLYVSTRGILGVCRRCYFLFRGTQPCFVCGILPSSRLVKKNITIPIMSRTLPSPKHLNITNRMMLDVRNLRLREEPFLLPLLRDIV